MHPEDPITWVKHFAPTGAIDEWVGRNRVGPLAGYLTEEVSSLCLNRRNYLLSIVQEKWMHRKIFQDGYEGGLDWYRARILNVGLAEEKGLDLNLPQRVLMVVAKRDPVGDPKLAEAMKQFVPDLTWKEVDSGHWLQLEKSEEVNGALEDFFNGE